MRLAAIFVAALALGACAHESARSQATTPANQDVATAAWGAVEQWRQAYQVRSEEALAKVYAHDPMLVVVIDGRAVVGWPAVEAMLKERLSRSQKIVIRLRDSKIVTLGPAAASVSATVVRELGDDVTTQTDNGALTMVLRKDGPDWVIVTEHYSLRKGG